MNPLNLLDDAERLRIRGTHDPQHTVITWEVQVGSPPGSRWDTLLRFDAPVGSDPATAYAIPEGLECLVGTAAAHHGLNVHVEPVRGAGGNAIADFNELRRRMSDALDAAVLPPGHEVESVPAPRCAHNFLNPHTVTAGNLENGYIERKCRGGLGYELLNDEADRLGYHVDAHREGDELHVDIAYRVPPRIDGPIDVIFHKAQPWPDAMEREGLEDGPTGPQPGPDPSPAFCGSAVPHAPHTWRDDRGLDPARCPGLEAAPPQDPPEGTVLHRDDPVPTCQHGQIGPHGIDAIDGGPTCPGPGAAFRYEGDKISIVPTCQHGRTEAHQIWTTQHADPGHCDGPTRLPDVGPTCGYCAKPRSWTAARARCGFPQVHAPDVPSDPERTWGVLVWPNGPPAVRRVDEYVDRATAERLIREVYGPRVELVWRYDVLANLGDKALWHDADCKGWHTDDAEPGCSAYSRGEIRRLISDEDTRPYTVGCPTCGRHTCPGRDRTTPCVWDANTKPYPTTQGTSEETAEAGSPPASEEARVNTSGVPVCGAYLGPVELGTGEPIRCSQPVPCPAHDPSGRWGRKVDADPPTCSTCDRPIMVVPGAGFGVGASWQHRDGSKGHEARPNLIIDPMPEACRRLHPGEQCRPGDNHPAAATPTSAGSTRPMYVTDEEL